MRSRKRENMRTRKKNEEQEKKFKGVNGKRILKMRS